MVPYQGNHIEGFDLDMTTREMLVGPGEGYTCRVPQLRWLLSLMLSAIPWRWTKRWGVIGPKFIKCTGTDKDSENLWGVKDERHLRGGEAGVCTWTDQMDLIVRDGT